MNYHYFKAKKGNFGDDLNPWIWSRLFHGNSDEDTLLLGIGSILHDRNHELTELSNKKKIVFGTGVRPSASYNNLIIDNSWDIRFLRGPLSSFTFDNEYKYISDAAYAIRHVKDFSKFRNLEKKHKISVMPYFHSVDFFDWEKLCLELGFNYISPLSENGVEYTLKEISQSEFLITEAMHGAILADALRTPWHRFVLTTPFTEGERVSDFKWNDWLQSINLNVKFNTFIPLYKKTSLYYRIKKISSNALNVQMFHKNKTEDDILNKLSKIQEYYLSEDNAINVIDSKINEEILKVNKS